jgi:hypothetical protein
VCGDRSAETVGNRKEHTIVRTDEERTIPARDRHGSAVRPDAGVDHDEVDGVVRRFVKRLRDDERTSAHTTESVDDVDHANGRSDPCDDEMANADELVYVAVVGGERDQRSHALRLELLLVETLPARLLQKLLVLLLPHLLAALLQN